MLKEEIKFNKSQFIETDKKKNSLKYSKIEQCSLSQNCIENEKSLFKTDEEAFI